MRDFCMQRFLATYTLKIEGCSVRNTDIIRILHALIVLFCLRIFQPVLLCYLRAYQLVCWE